MKILITDDVSPLLTNLLNKHSIAYECKTEESIEELLNIIHQFKGLIVRNRLKIDAEFLHKAKNLKFIARYGSGMESIDLDIAKKFQIDCFNSAEGNANSVGEHTIGILLSLLHNIYYSGTQVEKNIWRREENRGIELANKTIGIIGYGHTGQSFSQKLNGFNCKILSYDKYKNGFGNRHVEETTMQNIYSYADIISLHVPLKKDTQHLVNAEFIAKMKKPFYLLNTSRGPVVSNKDLVQSLKENKILGAALDVIENENFKFSTVHPDPDLNYLLNCKNVIITPHIAGLSKESNKKLSEVLIAKILKLI